MNKESEEKSEARLSRAAGQSAQNYIDQLGCPSQTGHSSAPDQETSKVHSKQIQRFSSC